LLGTTNRIVVTNGNGTADPTFDIGSSVATSGNSLNFFAPTTSAQLAGVISDESGSGALVFNISPSLTTPTIASFANAAHNHEGAAGGGQLNAGNVFSAGTVPVARLPIMVGDAGAGGVAGLVPAPVTGDATKFLRGDATWQTVSGGGGSPGGSNTQLQYNNAGAFGGISGATSDGTDVTFGSANLRATSPRFTTDIRDSNGNSIIGLVATGTGVNQISVANASTGISPAVSATGADANVNLTFSPKGTGVNRFTKNLFMNVGTGSLDNLIYVQGTTSGPINASFGFFVGGIGSQQASDGPYFLGRGNSFSAISNQRGVIFLNAGSPDTPVADEGTIQFATGGDATKVTILRDGVIRLTGIALGSLGTPANGSFAYCNDCNVNTDPCTSGGTGSFAHRLNGRWYCP
jgi:hypothetical protein